VGTLGQVAARAALADQAHVQAYVALNQVERTRVSDALTALGLQVAPSQANFVFVNFGRDNKTVYDKLLRMGVIVRPMPVPPGSWIRITIGLPEENDRLLASVRKLQDES